MLSERQRKLLAAPLPRMTIVQGCISSGKTFIANHKAVAHIAGGYRGQGLIFFAGRTLKTLERNVLRPLAEQYAGMLDYSLNLKTARLCGARIELEGCDDLAAEARLRGSTAWFIYGDELTLWNRPFLLRCMGSLRAPGACFLGTTNPDGPTHFVKRDFLDRAEELGLWDLRFDMGDNPALSEDYRRQVAREYTGVFHRRFILGQWVRAEGAIYTLFLEDEARFYTGAPEYDFIQVGVDFGGNKSAHTFVACGLKHDRSTLTALCSERWGATGMEPEKLYRLFEDFLARVERVYGRVAMVYADSAEQTLINGMRARVDVPVRNALKRPVMDRVRAVCALMGQGRFALTRDCASLANALREAVYDHRQVRDARLDDGSTDVDSLDAFEYGFERWMEAYMGAGRPRQA